MNKIVLLMLALATLLFSEKIKLPNETKMVNKYYQQFSFEWQYVMKDKHKEKVIAQYTLGKSHDLAETAPAIAFIETRGNSDRINYNFKEMKLTYDCSIYGINTANYLATTGQLDSRNNHMEACISLKRDEVKAREYMFKVIKFARSRYKHIENDNLRWLTVISFYHKGFKADESLDYDYIFQIKAFIKLYKTLKKTGRI